MGFIKVGLVRLNLILLFAGFFFGLHGLSATERALHAQTNEEHRRSRVTEILGYSPEYEFTRNISVSGDDGEVIRIGREAQIPLWYLRRVEDDAVRLAIQSNQLMQQNGFAVFVASREMNQRDMMMQGLGYHPMPTIGRPIDTTQISCCAQKWKDIALCATTSATVLLGTLYLLERRKNNQI